MLTFGSGDLFLSEAQTLAHGVNCRGIMGAGIAIEFKKHFPAMFDFYQNSCIRGNLSPGNYQVFDTGDRKVLNLATQEGLNGAHLKYIKRAFRKLAEEFESHGITSIAIPQVGAGYGGLDWREVKSLLIEYWEPMPIPIYVFEHFKKGEKFKPFHRVP